MKWTSAIRSISAPFRDAVYPMLSLESRAWRRAPRFYLRQRAVVTLGNRKRTECEVTLDDFSASGFALSGPADRIATLLRKKHYGDEFNISIRLTGRDWILPVQLVRRTKKGDRRRAAFRVTSRSTMEAFISDVQIIPRPGVLAEKLTKWWMSRGFRYAATTLWIFAMAGAILLVPLVAKGIISLFSR